MVSFTSVGRMTTDRGQCDHHDTREFHDDDHGDGLDDHHICTMVTMMDFSFVALAVL